MAKSQREWNVTLKFSWGHIVSFLALIFISYVSYMGEFYANGGDFGKAALKVAIIDAVLLVGFMSVQMLKAIDHKFKRFIIIERIVMVFCVVAFVWSMIPYNHFWTVYKQKDTIENLFNSSVEESRNIFVEYEDYANKRIQNYATVLKRIYPDNPTRCSSYETTLRLQLLSNNYYGLKESANKWLDMAGSNTSVWNAFLVGNISQIQSAMDGWHEELWMPSRITLSNEKKEGNVVEPFDEDDALLRETMSGFEELKAVYQHKAGVSFMTILTGLGLFILLLFPYLLQRRNTRAQGFYKLLPFGKGGKKAVIDFDSTSGQTTGTRKKFDQQETIKGNTYKGTF